MNRIFTLLVLLLSFTATAQNYNTLHFKKPQFFKGDIQFSSPFASASNVKVMYFDSTFVIGNFTEYYGFRSIRGDFGSQNCIDSAGKSWFGSFGSTDTAGVQVYLNQYDQTIRLETKDTINQTWTAFYYFNNDILEAKVTAINNGSVFNVNDETKTISFTRKDLNGNIIPDYFNGKEFQISRDSGWISLVDFYNFPNDTSSVTRVPTVIIPTKGAYYDFQVGDVFQYHASCFQWPNGSTPGSYIEREILSRQDYIADDSVSYTALEKIMSLTFNPFPTPHIDTAFSQSVITMNYSDLSNPFFNEWPEEAITETNYNGSFAAVFSYGLLESDYCQGDYDLTYTIGNVIKSEFDTCYPTPFEPTPRTYEFAPGLGRTNLIDDQMSIVGPLCSIPLIWYNKNGITCGNHVSLTGLNEISFDQSWSIGPNPVTDELKIQFSKFMIADLHIYSSDGKLQKMKSFNGSNLSISVNDLAAGVYYLQLQENAKNSYKKFIVTR